MLNKKSLKIILPIISLIAIGIYVNKGKPPKVDHQNLTFNRPDVHIHHVEFDSVSGLTKHLKSKGLKYAPLHRGLAIWSVTPDGEPIGDCTIFYVKDDLETKAHEERHCREGQFHYNKE